MDAPTRDYVRPKSKGHTLTPNSRALSCSRCNEEKGSRSLASWEYRLEQSGDPRATVVRAIIAD